MVGVPKGHDQGVSALAFSPDGMLLASASNDRTIIVWDLASGKARCALKGYENVIQAVCFSPDGSSLASGDASKLIKIWAVKTARLVCTLTGHTETVTSVAFAPDGKSLVSASLDTTVRVWDVAQQKQIGTMVHRGMVYSLAISPDGNSLVTGCVADVEALKDLPKVTMKDVVAALSQPAEVILWDSATRQQRISFKLPSGLVSSIAYAADGRRIVVGTRAFGWPYQGEVLILDILRGTFSKPTPPRPFTGGITAVALSRGGKWLAAVCFDRTIRLWEFIRFRAQASDS